MRPRAVSSPTTRPGRRCWQTSPRLPASATQQRCDEGPWAAGSLAGAPLAPRPEQLASAAAVPLAGWQRYCIVPPRLPSAWGVLPEARAAAAALCLQRAVEKAAGANFRDLSSVSPSIILSGRVYRSSQVGLRQGWEVRERRCRRRCRRRPRRHLLPGHTPNHAGHGPLSASHSINQSIAFQVHGEPAEVSWEWAGGGVCRSGVCDIGKGTVRCKRRLAGPARPVGRRSGAGVSLHIGCGG